MKRYCGRDFSEPDFALIRALIAEDGQRSRAELSRLACRALHWYKPDGGLKEMSCRVAMLRMQKDGLIPLPLPRNPRPRARIRASLETEPQAPIQVPVHALPNLQLRLVGTGTDSRRWNEYIQRYHYLGYQALPGAQLRYWVSAGDTLMALLGFGAAAWQCAPRDDFIGWSHAQRQNNLHLVVNNARFLILPWVQSKNLASRSWASLPASFPRIGKTVTVTGRCCWRPSSNKGGSKGFVTKPPTGSRWGKPKVAANSAPPGNKASRSKTSGCIPWKSASEDC